MRKQNYFKAYNCIITDPMLYSSSKRVMSTLLAYCSPKDTVRKTVEELSILSGVGTTTVRKALAELEARGFIRKLRRYRTSRYFSCPIYAANTYKICRRKLSGGFTLIPRALLQANISHSTFVTVMYIYKTAGRKGRAYPSLRNAAKRLDLAKATICRALKTIRRLQLVCKRECKRGERFFCNSYFPTAWVRAGGLTVDPNTQKSFSAIGGLIFNKHHVINKITGVYIMREEDKGVGEFGDLYSFLDDMLCAGVSVPVLTTNTA